MILFNKCFYRYERIEGDPWVGNAMPVPIERLLFGSHAPYFPVETNLIKLFESPLTLHEIKAIMYSNAQKFKKGI